MTVLFIDGFRQYSSLSQKYDTASGGVLHSTGGPTGGGYVSWGHGTVPTVSRNVPSGSTWYMGARFSLGSGGADYGSRIFQLWDGGARQMSVGVAGDGVIDVCRSNGIDEDVVASSDSPMTANEWTWLEARMVVGNANGAAEVRVNGVVVIDETGLDTDVTSSGRANRAGFYARDALWNIRAVSLTDLYIANDAGGQDFYGDMRIETLVPTSAGAHSDWTPTTGYGFECVDELPGNATDYIHALDIGMKDTYVYSNLSVANGTVVAVQHGLLTKKSDYGTRYYSPISRVGGTDYEGSILVAQNDWTVGVHLETVNPDTSVAWTISDVNNAEFGVAVVHQ
jgi:hypothetical protein